MVALIRYPKGISIHIIASVVFSLISLYCSSQTVESVSPPRLEGEKIILTYDLNFHISSEKFTVLVYSSHDDFAQPLTLVEGDVGDNIIPGKGYRIVWDAKNALPADFDGELTFKIKAVRMSPKIAVAPLTQTSYKKGRTVKLDWTGGASDYKLDIFLYRNNVLKQLLVEGMDNKNTYAWKIPKKEKGKGYALRIARTGQAIEYTESTTFRIKPKVPFIVKALPFLAAGAAIGIMSGSGGGSDDGGGSDLSDLPGPVKPGGG